MSDSTVIQPAPGQAILTTDSSNHHRDHGHHGEGRQLAEFIALAGDVRNSTSVTGDRINTVGQITGDRINTVGAAGALASGNTDRLVQTGLAGVHDRLCDAKAGIVSALGTGFTADALAACKTQDAVALVDKNAVTLAKDNLIAMNVGFSAVNTQAAAIGSAAQVLATAFAGQARDQATMYANAATAQAQAIAAAATVQVERVRAELALQAEQNANAQALAMCKCCGEMQAQADRNLAAITATSMAGTQRILDRICDDKNADLRAQLVATQRMIPVTVAVGT